VRAAQLTRALGAFEAWAMRELRADKVSAYVRAASDFFGGATFDGAGARCEPCPRDPAAAAGCVRGVSREFVHRVCAACPRW
jgi:hypothetical protein